MEKRDCKNKIFVTYAEGIHQNDVIANSDGLAFLPIKKLYLNEEQWPTRVYLRKKM